VDSLRESGRPFRLFSRTSYTDGCEVIDFERAETYQDCLKFLDVVVLLVSQSSPATYQAYPDLEIERNVLAYARFLRVLDASSVKHVIYISSGGTIYGRQQHALIDELHPIEPTGYYGCAKSMIESLIKTNSKISGRQYTILRPSNPVGAYQLVRSGVGVVAAAIKAALNGGAFEIWGDGQVIRDYFDVRDLVDAIFRVIDLSVTSDVFNVSSGLGLRVLDVVDLVSAVSGRDIDVKLMPGRTVDVPENVLSSAKLAHQLRWNPQYSIEQTIEYMLNCSRN